MHLLSDSPIRAASQDKWGLKNIAQEIYDNLPGADDLPITIGIFGSWGSGKTSLLRVIEDLAKGNPRYRTVWFNAWKYQSRQEVWPALVQTVLSDLAKEKPARAIRKKISLLARAAGQVFAGRALQLLTHGAVSAKDFDDLISKIRDLQQEEQVQLAGFDRAFGEVLKDSLHESQLLLLIDDLDRCSPSTTLEVLEGIKLFLASDRCIFLVALDFESLLASISATEGHSASYRISYLEKMIQAIRYVPPPPENQLRSALELMSGLEVNEELWFLIMQASNGNPRRAKRFINMYMLMTGDSADTTRKEPGANLLLAKILVIRTQFPKYFQLLEANPTLLKKVEDELLADPEVTPEELVEIDQEHLLLKFLTDTLPGRQYWYPSAPDNKKDATELIRLAATRSMSLVRSFKHPWRQTDV